MPKHVDFMYVLNGVLQSAFVGLCTILYLTQYCQLRCILLNNSENRTKAIVINLVLLYSRALQGSVMSYV